MCVFVRFKRDGALSPELLAAVPGLASLTVYPDGVLDVFSLAAAYCTNLIELKVEPCKARSPVTGPVGDMCLPRLKKLRLSETAVWFGVVWLEGGNGRGRVSALLLEV